VLSLLHDKRRINAREIRCTKEGYGPPVSCPAKLPLSHKGSQLRTMWLDERSLSIEVLMADQEVKRDELFWLA